MAHHFDTELSLKDPRLNICDMYLFDGSADTTVMVMTTNGDTGLSVSDTLHPEGLYAFRFDLDGDAKEEVVFTFRFGDPFHAGGEHRHTQEFRILRATGAGRLGMIGEDVAAGTTGCPIENAGIKVFVGKVADLWAADAEGFRAIISTLAKADRFDAGIFGAGRNYFARRNVMALVLEVPNAMIGSGRANIWSTISLFGHAPEVQVCRFGTPLFTHLLLAERRDLFQAFHASEPRDDIALFGEPVAAFIARLSKLAGGETSHAASVAGRLCPSLLPYTIGTKARFTPELINGRPLDEDAFDVMWTLAAGRPISDGLFPDLTRFVPRFPYYGAPFMKAEQSGLLPLVPNSTSQGSRDYL